MNIQNNLVENIDQNAEGSVTTNLLDVLMNLRNAEMVYNNECTMTSDLLDITMDTHGAEVTEELVQMCKNDDAELFDVLADLHGTERMNDLIYTYGKMKGRKFGQELGKCKNPNSAIKHISENIQSHYNISKYSEILDNEQEDTTSCLIDSKPATITYTKKQTSTEDETTKPLRKNRKVTSINPLFINTQGFIEGALSFMTGMQASITDSDKNKIYFKESKKRFFGLL